MLNICCHICFFRKTVESNSYYCFQVGFQTPDQVALNAIRSLPEGTIVCNLEEETGNVAV